MIGKEPQDETEIESPALLNGTSIVNHPLALIVYMPRKSNWLLRLYLCGINCGIECALLLKQFKKNSSTVTFLLFTTHLLGQTVIYVSDVYVFGHHISHFRNIKNRPFFHDRFSKRNNSFIQRFVFIQRPAVVYVRYVKNKFHFLHSTTNIRSTKNQFPFFPLQEDFFLLPFTFKAGWVGQTDGTVRCSWKL